MRLLVASNRLPIVTVEENGQLAFKQSAGGLVSGVSAYLDSLGGSSFTQTEYLWIGWPGVTLDDPDKQNAATQALAELHASPVFLSERSMEKFYYGFCNKTIWPLFHYFPSYAAYDESFYAHYKAVNQIFCEAIIQMMRPDDVIWIHDYHLMLLPELLRAKAPSATIGFFLHIPFPSLEIFRLLPMIWRKEILEGLLGADLIGFHTQDYTQYFLRSVLRILGHEHNMGLIVLPDHLVKVGAFPMGIDFQRFHAAAVDLETCPQQDNPLEAIKDFKIVLSVDRLDYTKGIINRLQGYQLFLEQNPDWHQKVVLVLVVVPSRVGVDDYQRIKSQIDELVGQINGKFSSVGWTPVVYQYKFFSFKDLAALYAASHVALITPLRDGMNLIAKEYLACRRDMTGVLILSELTGAAKELGEAVIINPNTATEIAGALRTALEMPAHEQIRRNKIMQDRLRWHDVVRWASDFLTELSSVKAEQGKPQASLLGAAARRQLLSDFEQAHRRLILLDCDDVLASRTGNPQTVRPSHDFLLLLKNLSESAKNDVVLLSGYDKGRMQEWFDNRNVALVAEHGVWTRAKNSDWQLTKSLSNRWKPALLPVLQTYADRLPGAFVEEKEYSLIWHYDETDSEIASARVKELVDDMVSFTANIDVQVLLGNKAVEVRSGGVSKGVAATLFMPSGPGAFVLAIGDDWMDEELFQILPENAYSLRTGLRRSHARFHLHGHAEMLRLLQELAARDNHTPCCEPAANL